MPDQRSTPLDSTAAVEFNAGPCLKRGGGLRDQHPLPRNARLKMFNTILAYFCSCSCQYCYHVKQKYWLYFHLKPCATFTKWWKDVCGHGGALPRTRLGELTTFPQTPLSSGEGDAPLPILTPSTPSSSRYLLFMYVCIYLFIYLLFASKQAWGRTVTLTMP